MKKYIVVIVLLFMACLCHAEKVTIRIVGEDMPAGVMAKHTSLIQQAIDSCYAHSDGGCVILSEGVYTTGTLFLKSNVELRLEKGAMLMGSTNPYDYVGLEPIEGGDNSKQALILADRMDNIAITGEGMIDGNGRTLALNIDSLHHIGERIDPNYNVRRMRPNETARPKLFFLSACTNVRIEGVQLKNSACWGLSLDRCSDVTIEHIRFENRAYWNNDGIDITDCRRVAVRHCFINSADDGICLKSYHTDAFNEEIEITDCDIISSASAVKMGTASWGGFKKVRIKDIRIRDTFRSAIAIECVDGGVIDDILVENIRALNTGNALFIRLGHRKGEAPGTLKNVTIRNLYVEVPFGRPDIDYDMRGPAVDFFHNPIPSSITGIPGHRVENVVLEDIEVVYPGRASKGMAYIPLSRLHQVPEQIQKYPEFTMFGELPSWALFVRHVKGLTMHRVRFHLKDDDFRPPFVFDDVEELVMEEVDLPTM